MDMITIDSLGNIPQYVWIGTVVVSFLSLITGYYYYKFNFWRRQGVKGSIPMTPFGDLFGEISQGMRTNDLTNWKKYGNFYGVYEGTRPILGVTDPEFVKEILVTNFVSLSGSNFVIGHEIFKNMSLALDGAAWKKQRSVVSPTFTSGKMKAMMPMIEDSCEVLDKVIEKKINSDCKGVVQMKKVFDNFTIEVIAKCAFATDVKCQEQESDFQVHARGFFEISFLKLGIVLILPDFLVKYFQITPLKEEHTNYMAELCKQVIRTRREEPKEKLRKYPDFLALMLDSEEDFTEMEILASAIVILVAGFETTACLMTYMAYSLALNPEIQDKLIHEIDQMEKVDYESIFKLQYLDAVMNEALRMYPPFVRVERKALEDVTLSNGVFLPKGCGIRIPMYTIHHDPQLFPEPDVFKPERFLPENKDSLIPYSWIPFFDGPRNCVGRRFAEMETKLCFTRLLQKYKFVSCPETEPKLDFKKFEFVLMAKSVTIQLVKRK